MLASHGRVAQILAAPVRGTGEVLAPAALPAAPALREKYLLLAVLLLATLLRFWELGSFSLHKSDEDTTVLAAAHVLEDGTPRFPSGMFYARAIVQSYLIAASFKLFGESEWSARLPSALCGILAVLLGWLVARRFLEFPWRIGFALCLAVFPAMIADSQEARMYGFMVASLLGATWQVFRWDEQGHPRHLLFAVLWLLLAIQFQYVAVLGSAVLLFPGLSRGSTPRTLQAAAALVVVAVGYLLISEWQGGFYPELAREQYFPQWTDPLTAGPRAAVAGLLPAWAAAAAAVACGALVLLATRALRGTSRWVLGLLVPAAILLQAMQQYHLAVLCWLAAAILAWRTKSVDARLALLLLAGAIALAVAQLLHAMQGGHSLRQAAGAMLGWPSVWPLAQVAGYSWVAAVLVAAGAIVALLHFAQARRIHPVWLYFVLTVWVPVLVVGTQAWYVPPRYVQFAMVPTLLTAFVVVSGWLPRRGWIALPAALLIANPVASWQAVAVGDRAADHRAAAQFLEELPLREDDILIAEEVLMQSYYLGRVDYWLASPQVAGQFVVLRDGRFVNQYTHTPFVDSVAALERVIAEAGPRRVFVIGSAEPGDRTYFRGEELQAYLQGGNLETIYVGPTGNRIWRANGAP